MGREAGHGGAGVTRQGARPAATDGSAARVRRRAPTPEDEAAFLAAVARSRDLHHPWVQPPATPAAYAAFVVACGPRLQRHLLVTEDGDLVGLVNASEIVRGVFQSCYLGYYAFAPAAGTGLMTAGIRDVIAHLFDVEGLHRVEANIQPANARSLALVQRLGFRREGYSPGYLFIDGAWRDHERWALTSPRSDDRPVR